MQEVYKQQHNQRESPDSHFGVRLQLGKVVIPVVVLVSPISRFSHSRAHRNEWRKRYDIEGQVISRPEHDFNKQSREHQYEHVLQESNHGSNSLSSQIALSSL